MTEYNNNLSALRGLSFFMVVLFHYTFQLGRLINIPIDLELLHFCGYGVYLFFILSGRLIGYKLLVSASARDFIISRAIRIYPTYAVCVLISFTLFKILGSYKADLTPYDLFSNLSLAVFLNNTPRVDGVYWSLYLEIIFYLIIALLLLFKKHQKLILFSIFFLIICDINETVTKILTLNNTLIFFWFGVLQNRFNYRTKIIGYLALFFLSFINMPLPLGDFIILVLIYVFIIRIEIPRIIQGVLNFLGRISYTGYLLHQGIFFAIYLALDASNVPFYSSYIISLIATSIIIGLVFVLIEVKLTSKLYGCFR